VDTELRAFGFRVRRAHGARSEPGECRRFAASRRCSGQEHRARFCGRPFHGRSRSPRRKPERGWPELVRGCLPMQPLVAKGVSIGTESTCALHENGTVWCWGATEHGQLGNGDSASTYSTDPVRVAGISTAIAVTSGGTSFGCCGGGGFTSFHCALLRVGSVVCWGDVPGRPVTPKPVTMFGISQAIAVAGGGRHACALLASGSIQCWGANDHGQLGDGSMMDSAELATVVGIEDATAIGLSSSFSDFSCAVLSSGTVKCWGAYSAVVGATIQTSSTPISIPSSGTTASDATGEDQACVALPDGRVQCCCGEHPVVLTTVPNLPPSSTVSVGLRHACALLSDGAIKCWGHNGWGELGSSDPGQTNVLGAPDAVAVSAGWGETCAVRKDGGVWCWGRSGNGGRPFKVPGF
jgi:alpha-tubulin suppressor-like RCC1 family protein